MFVDAIRYTNYGAMYVDGWEMRLGGGPQVYVDNTLAHELIILSVAFSVCLSACVRMMQFTSER